MQWQTELNIVRQLQAHDFERLLVKGKTGRS